MLLYIAVAFLAQIALQPVIGVLSPSFGSAVAISVPTCLSFAAALTVFCLRANFLVIRRLPSGYLYGLHWQDDTKTLSVFIALFLLLSATAAMLIIKGVRKARQ